MAAGSASGGGSEGIKAGKAYVEIGAKDAGLKAGLNAAKRAVLSIGKDIAAAGGIGLGLGSAIMAPILASLKEVVEHFSAINRAAIRTGATTEAISDLGYAAKASGTSLEAVESGLKFLDKAMAAAAGGSEEAKDALAAFGLTVDDLKGKDADEKMRLISQGLQGIEESARGPALRALLGRGALSLRPMLENSAELNRLLQENAAVGGRVSKEDAENAEKVEKAYIRTTAAIKNAFLAIGAAILPHADSIDQFATGLTKAIRDVKEFIDENRAAVLAVLGVGAGIAAAGAALIGLGLAVSVAGAAIGGLMTLATTAGAVLALIFSPAGLIAAAAAVAALVAVAAVLELFPNQAAEAADAGEKLWKGFGETFGLAWQGIKDALKSGDLSLAFKIAADAVDVVWKAFLLGMMQAWNQFKKDFVDSWHDAMTEVKVAIAETTQWAREHGMNVPGKGTAGREIIAGITSALPLFGIGKAIEQGLTDSPAAIRAQAAQEQAARDQFRAGQASALAANLWLSIWKLRTDVAEAKGPPKELGPMPREVLRRAAVEGLGTVRGQIGGYGASFALGVSGEAIAKKQLTQLEEINENTKEGGGLRGW